MLLDSRSFRSFRSLVVSLGRRQSTTLWFFQIVVLFSKIRNAKFEVDVWLFRLDQLQLLVATDDLLYMICFMYHAGIISAYFTNVIRLIQSCSNIHQPYHEVQRSLLRGPLGPLQAPNPRKFFMMMLAQQDKKASTTVPNQPLTTSKGRTVDRTATKDYVYY